VKFLFKVWSNYDGFTPERIPERQLPGGLLQLGWSRYIEAVERGSEIWVYFHGSHRFDNGVYVKGVAHAVGVDERVVQLRVRDYSTDRPLTDAPTSARIADAVAARGLQVFLLPEFLDAAPACDVTTAALTCKARHCGSCVTWRRLPIVRRRNLGSPQRLPDEVSRNLVPAYWVIPPRNFMHMAGRRFKDAIRRTDELFKRFKTGEEKLAYPLALGMREALADRGLDRVDCVIPVPLSPDKAEAGEIHRTRLLARELGRLLGVPVREFLTLQEPISKRRLRGERGYGATAFEAAYRAALDVDQRIANYGRVALVDDVCTEGSTISACFEEMRRVNPELEVVATTAGQMTVRAAVRREDDLAL
jgi:predicted amidophosphoribosyltransferase